MQNTNLKVTRTAVIKKVVYLFKKECLFAIEDCIYKSFAESHLNLKWQFYLRKCKTSFIKQMKNS